MSYVQTEKAVYLYGPQVNIPYVPNANMNAGDVVDLGTCVGVALEPINTNGDPRGSLCIQGVFSFLLGLGQTASIGDTILWDNTNKVAYRTGGGYSDDACIGVCTKAAVNTDTTIEVYMHPFAHTAGG